MGWDLDLIDDSDDTLRVGGMVIFLFYPNAYLISISYYILCLEHGILRLYSEFQCPTMPGTGLKVCVLWWVGGWCVNLL